jgi:hypothetical protein
MATANATAEAPAAFVYNYGYAGTAGVTLGSGNGITVFAPTPSGIVSGLLGGPSSLATLSNTGTNTLGAAVTTFIPSCLGEETAVAAGTNNPVILQEVFDGSIIIPPGYFMFPAATVASGALYVQRFTWIETPVTSGLY